MKQRGKRQRSVVSYGAFHHLFSVLLVFITIHPCKKYIQPNDDERTTTEKQEGVRYQAWRTTPFDVAASISRGLADSSVVSRVTYSSFVPDYDAAMDGMDGVDLDEAMADLELDEKDEDGGNAGTTTMLWDMTRPLVGNVSKIEFLKFEDDQDARTAFWHSSAHVLGEALERLYGSRLTVGPPLAGGFYYDSYMGDGTADGALKEDDCECSL